MDGCYYPYRRDIEESATFDGAYSKDDWKGSMIAAVVFKKPTRLTRKRTLEKCYTLI